METPRRRPSVVASAELLKLVVESVKDYAVIVLDPQGLVATWNPGAARIKGYRPADVVGRHFSIFYTREDRDRGRCERLLETARRHGRAADEGWRVRKDGTRFWAGVVITALRDKRRRLIGYAKITRDLTERKNREEALARAKAELEESVDFLKRDVDDGLSRISTFAALLEDKPLDDDERRLAVYIADNAARVRALVAGMLECGKSGPARAGFAPTSLSVVIAAAAKELTNELGVTGVEVSHGKLPIVHGDAALLVRMFRHLLLTMAMVGRGGARTTIIVDSIERDDDRVVRFRAASPKSSADEGEAGGAAASSLDVAVVMKIASMHGGMVWARSSPEPGSEFFVSFPLEKAAVDD